METATILDLVALSSDEQCGERKLSVTFPGDLFLTASSQLVGGPSVRWYEIQQLFFDITFDVLLLFDCCYAAQAGRSSGEGILDETPGGVELLAAASDRTETPQPGDGSFTTAMIKRMNELIKKDRRVEISELHTLLVHRAADLYTVPFHVHIRAGLSKRSIVLEKLKAQDEYDDTAVAWKSAVGITIGMREPLNPAMLDQIKRWLYAEAPRSFVAGFKVERVLRQTAAISDFIENSLPERSGVVAQSLDVSMLGQIGEAWSELQRLVARYKSRHSIPGFAQQYLQENRVKQLADEFIKRLDAGNTEVTQLLIEAIMKSGASSTPALIDEALQDPTSESLGMTRQLVLRRIICCQQRPGLEVKTTATRSVVHIAPDRLLEEYKNYDEHQSSEEVLEMKARIGLLATVLEASKPESFRCLQLYDWNHEERRRRFVYHFVIPDEYKKKSITLHDAIMTLEHQSRPTLEERLTMAYNIAKAVAQWHRVDWVHQSISSHNVIFLKPISGHLSDRWDFSAPLLHGFDFARPNAKPSIGRYVENIALDIYRHPDRQGDARDGHKKEHDLYSLGVVLLEVGLWQSSRVLVEYLTQKRQNTPVKEGEMIKVERKDVGVWMADAVKNSLAYHVGSDYRDAVRTCLTSDFGVIQDDERKSKLLDAMDKMVLQKLRWRSID